MDRQLAAVVAALARRMRVNMGDVGHLHVAVARRSRGGAQPFGKGDGVDC